MTNLDEDRWLLRDHLASAALIARRLARSRERIGRLMPIDAAGLGILSDGDEEAIEGYARRSLAGEDAVAPPRDPP